MTCPPSETPVVSAQSLIGYTMLEVMIAAGIMFALVGSLLSAWSATTDFSYMVNENLKRMEAMDLIRNSLTADFNQSAQFVQYDTAAMVASVNTTTNESINLYPAILQGGREVRFTRMRSTITAAATPAGENPYLENLSGTNAQPLSQFALAPVSPCFIINPAAGQPGYWNVCPVWESNLSGLTFNQNCDPANLRIYRYILVPYSNTIPSTLADSITYATSNYPLYPQAGTNVRRGMLLRQYRNAGSTTWQTVGSPLSDSLVFDTANNENSATLPCFVFSTAYDGVTRTGTEIVNDNEVRLKMSLAMEAQRGPAIVLDSRLSFPFCRVDFGE